MFEKQHIIKHVLFAHRNTVFNDVLFHKEKNMFLYIGLNSLRYAKLSGKSN